MHKRPDDVTAMRVGGIVVDPDTQAPIVILRGKDDPRVYLPIFIGGTEATAIATALTGIDMPRPMTHDLMTHTLAELAHRVICVTVTDLIDGTFYSEIVIADERGERINIDSRPSDALALALRSGAHIAVANRVLVQAGRLMDEETALDELEAQARSSGAEPGLETSEQESTEQESTGDSAPETIGPTPVINADIRLEDIDPDLFGKYKM
jgi:bifunctional DNase/RNase